MTKNKIIKDIPIKVISKDKPFLEKGYVFDIEYNIKWLINFKLIPDLVKNAICYYYNRYENWFNLKFNTPFIKGE